VGGLRSVTPGLSHRGAYGACVAFIAASSPAGFRKRGVGCGNSEFGVARCVVAPLVLPALLARFLAGAVR